MSPQTSIAARPSKPAKRSSLSVIGPPKLLSMRKEPRTGLGVPLPSLQKEARMGLFTKDIKTMEDLLLHGLQDIYYAEQQIIKSLPKMIGKVTNRDLATGLKSHLEETYKQVERLEKAFEKLGK